MSQIAFLPEILRHIISYLPFSDTASVARVSRQWHACSEEQLYTELRLIRPNSTVALLLRTLLTPGLERLATYVRSLSVDWQLVSVRPMHECDVAVLEAAARIGLSQIVRSIGEQVWLLLHLLPRLDALTMESRGYSFTIDLFIGRMHEPSDVPLALRSVRYISCVDIATEAMRVMFRLPRIRTLELWILDRIKVPFPAADHQTSDVTDLVLLLSQVDNLSVAHILQIPRALTRLTVSIGYVQHTGQLALMRVALEPVRTTVQQLKMDIVETWWYEEAPIDSFLLLRTWPVLRRLWCPLNWLLGGWKEEAKLHLYAVLPRSLREFWVHGDHDWTRARLLPEVILLVQRKEEVVPLLQKLCIEREGKYEIKQEQEIELEEQLSCVCRDSGVVLAGMGDW